MLKTHPFDEFPKHLYHETLPNRIAHTREEEAALRADGYGDNYVHREFPKFVAGRIAHNAQEEKQFLEASRAGNE